MESRQTDRYADHDDLAEQPTGELIRELFGETKKVLAEGTRLLRAEMDSARQEMRREAKKVGPAAAMSGAGGVLAHAAVLMFAVAIAAALAAALPTWLAFAIVGVLLAAAGAILFAAARNKVRTIALKPERTIHNLQEDGRWTKGLTRSARSNHRLDT
jgi:protein-S-isoprenylcysteine O-methyltransferase Ste14